MSFKAVIFDLDGTLLNTLQDIVHTLNTVLARRNYPVHTLDECRFLVGHGLKELVRKALPEKAATPETIDLVLADLVEVYSENWNVHSRPYPGIPTLLDRLSELGIRKAILSNKAHEFTQLCADILLGNWKFDAVLGYSSGMEAKPDPEGAFRVSGLLGVQPSSILYVGDSGIDMLTASRAGMYPLGVLWGFRPESELLDHGAKSLVKHPEEILRFFTHD
ncbi:MAG: HAD family hydrolase [Chlorobiaceae bacterium]|nr:HAD family hydrolase [Chlorobiaceae bacterium]